MKTCGKSRRWRKEWLTMVCPTKMPQTTVQVGFEVASFTSYQLHSCIWAYFSFVNYQPLKVYFSELYCESVLPSVKSPRPYVSHQYITFPHILTRESIFYFPPGGGGGFKIGFIVVLVLLILLIIAVIAFCIWQRKHSQYSEVHKGAEPAWCKCSVLYCTFDVFEVTGSFFMATTTPWVGQLATAAFRASTV